MARRLPSAVAAAAALTLAAWAFFPVVLLIAHAAAIHATWTGADGLIGADGVLGADQLQYLAWARGVALHGLASDLFTLGRSAHVYLEPASGVAGAFAVAGAGLVSGYLVVKAVAVLVLAGGTAAWCGRLLGGRGRFMGAQLAAVAPRRRAAREHEYGDRLDDEIPADEARAGHRKRTGRAGGRLQVDMGRAAEREQVGGEPVQSHASRPGQVLQLVGAEHAVGADQPVGAGPRGMDRGGVGDEQDDREECPRRQRERGRRRDR